MERRTVADGNFNIKLCSAQITVRILSKNLHLVVVFCHNVRLMAF
jgi:hypothetical protein